jgi:hypothetical protein
MAKEVKVHRVKNHLDEVLEDDKEEDEEKMFLL